MGGYTETEWDDNGGDKSSNHKSFIFRLRYTNMFDPLKIPFNKSGGCSEIWTGKDHPINFGQGVFKILPISRNNDYQSSWCNHSTYSIPNSKEEFKLTPQRSFNCIEIEIFGVLCSIGPYFGPNFT